MTLVWRPGFQFDADASTYNEAVEAADTQALETGVRYAINDFVIGCKQDGIWSAIKASCILAGARTLAGALTPLAGTAPNRFGTEGGWNYNRKTGLQGNGTDNYLNSNRNNNADPQNSIHLACFVSSSFGNSRFMIASADNTSVTNLYKGSTGNAASYLRGGTIISSAAAITTGFFGSSRTSGTSINGRYSGVSVFNNSSTSVSPSAEALEIFRSSTYPSLYLGDGRLAFYSIGESLDLAKLDTRVSALITAFQAPGVIP